MKPPNVILQENRDESTVIAAGSVFEWNIVVTNRSTQMRELLSIEVPFQPPGAPASFMLKGPLPKPGRSLQLSQNNSHIQGIRFSSKPRCSGTFRTTLIFNFTTWVLEHEVVVTVSDAREALPAALPPRGGAAAAPIAPVPAASTMVTQPPGAVMEIVPAIPKGRECKLPGAKLLSTISEYTGKTPLAEYPLPADIVDTIEGRKAANFNPWKTQHNYRTRLHELLWLEEAKQRQLTRHYDMRGVPIEPVSDYLDANSMMIIAEEPLTRVHCANLAEKRPSVQRADKVYAWLPSSPQKQWEGFVHRVEGDALLLLFGVGFHDVHPPGTLVDLRFDVERLNARLMHRAVDDVLLELAYPQVAPIKEPVDALVKEIHEIATRLPCTELNGQQRAVIARLLRVPGAPAPFLLFGPFGTGKTRTLTEYLRLLTTIDVAPLLKPPAGAGSATAPAVAEHTHPSGWAAAVNGGKGKGGKKGATRPPPPPPAASPSVAVPIIPKEDVRVLVCSPSNSSADAFINALAPGLSPEQMLRLYAAHRNQRGLPPRLKAYSSALYDERDELFVDPTAEALLKYRVVVATTRNASALVSAGVPRGHFTHIVVDEAAQLMEAEALLPLSLAGPRTQVIMAGDPQQLGPTTFSRVESVHGLHCSIMERMAALPLYVSSKFLSSRLTNNYRSHPTLVRLLSRISYEGQLQPMAKRERVEALAGWSKRKTKQGFPMLFCSVKGGSEAQEEDSPSFYNYGEAAIVADLVGELLNDVGGALAPEEVGVITPFYKQTQKLRGILRQRGLGRVKVGSTEEFHGHECRALFISTVRTSADQLAHDELYDTGFVGNVKRFNTALSRAVCLAVAVGDEGILARAPEWVEMIKECRKNDSFITLQAPEQPPALPPAAPSAPVKPPPIPPAERKPVTLPIPGAAVAPTQPANGAPGPMSGMLAISPAEQEMRDAVLREQGHSVCDHLNGPLGIGRVVVPPPEPHTPQAALNAGAHLLDGDRLVRGASPDSGDSHETPEWARDSIVVEPAGVMRTDITAAAVEEARVSRRGGKKGNLPAVTNENTANGVAQQEHSPPKVVPGQNPQAQQFVPSAHQLAPAMTPWVTHPPPTQSGFAVPMCAHSADVQPMYNLPNAQPNGGLASAIYGGLPVVQAPGALPPIGPKRHGPPTPPQRPHLAHEVQPQPPAPQPIPLPPNVTQVLYSHGGEGILFCTGPPPPFAIYEVADGLKMEISTFNMKDEFLPIPWGFELRLKRDEAKAAAASSFRTAANPSGAPETLTLLKVVTSASSPFDITKADLQQCKTTFEVLLPKRDMQSVPMLSVRRVE